MQVKTKALKTIFNFYINSNDYNGILLSQLAEQLKIEYLKILPIITELILEGHISVQAGGNPHIIRLGHYSKEIQLEIIKKAEKNEIKVIHSFTPTGFKKAMEPINIISESHQVCVYPSQIYLTNNHTIKYETEPFRKCLAYGMPQLTAVFFEIDVLERYFIDPRYRFRFDDYSGQISIVATQSNPSSLKEPDQIFIKTFGLGYDDMDNRVAVVYLRYLSSLSPEHQMYWHSKLVSGNCKMVKEYYENTILGNWSSNQSIYSAVIEELNIINKMSLLVNGKTLFRENFNNEKRPKEFTFFTSPTLANYERFISLLDKMISDNINKDFFKGEIETFELVHISEGVSERIPKGTLRLLDEWLKLKFILEDISGYEKIMKPLKDVRKERQNPAHKITENYYDKEFFKKQLSILEKVYQSLLNIRYIFQQHPKSYSVKIPKWLEEGKIHNF